jgi:hypothetical protein
MRWFVFAMMLLSCSGCAFADLPASKFTVHVTNAETGLPVTNAIVQTVFEHVYDPWGNKKPEIDRRKETVDQDGYITFTGESVNAGIGCPVEADGYYSGWGGVELEQMKRNHILNRWEPWNPMIEVKMRSIKNPVSMVHKRVEWKFKIPKYDMPIGLDLARGDWVHPYGSGVVSDMTIEIIPLHPAEKGSQCRISFPNPEDGIQEYAFEWPTSDFKWPYLAPTNGYNHVLDKHYVLNLPKIEGVPEHNLNKNANYLVRTRTQVDKSGQVISACYGYFQGEIMFLPKGEFQFEYWFNPVPNERSLEYNGINLLKK